MKLRILLVEDDHLQSSGVRRALEASVGANVETKSTESEFQSDFDAIAANPPQVVVMDAMLRWANPSPSMPSAPEHVLRNPEGAGLRCARRLRQDPRTKGVKVILYSVLAEEDFGGTLPSDVIPLIKENDWQNLIDKVTEIVAGSVTDAPAEPPS